MTEQDIGTVTADTALCSDNKGAEWQKGEGPGQDVGGDSTVQIAMAPEGDYLQYTVCKYLKYVTYKSDVWL